MYQITLIFILDNAIALAQCCAENNILDDKVSSDTFVNQILREGDVAWSSRAWKLIDARGIPTLLSTLQFRVATSDIKSYKTENFKGKLSSEQFRLLMIHNDSAIDPLDSTKFIVTPKQKVISHFIIKEDYFLNLKSSKMQRKILGLGLVAVKYDAEGLFAGNEVLCWFYYPAIRCCLSKDSLWLHRRKGDTLITLESYFTQHWFTSSSLQSSNVQTDILHRLNLIRGREENLGKEENNYWQD